MMVTDRRSSQGQKNEKPGRFTRMREMLLSFVCGLGGGKRKMVVVLTACCLFSIIYDAFYTVNEGERAVILTNGRVSSVEGSGLHVKVPFFQSVVKMSIRTKTMSLQKLAMYSFDQQLADLSLSVTWRNNPSRIREIYAEYGPDAAIFENIVSPRVTELSKSVFGCFNAEKAIQERTVFAAQLNSAVRAALQGLPVVIENVQVENLKFSRAYEIAVEQAAKAKADVERAKSELLRVQQEAQQKVANAEAQATATKAQADADAYSAKVRGEAEAYAIKARGDALKQNREMVDLVVAEKWNGALPATMVPGAALPFLNLR